MMALLKHNKGSRCIFREKQPLDFLCYSLDDEKVELLRRKKGRFILATNELDREKLPDMEVLSEYKEQSKTESGFRFIKDDAFELSSIYLKKPSRIAALMMVMTLCLMVYSVAQYNFRQSLREAKDDIPVLRPAMFSA